MFRVGWGACAQHLPRVDLPGDGSGLHGVNKVGSAPFTPLGNVNAVRRQIETPPAEKKWSMPSTHSNDGFFWRKALLDPCYGRGAFFGRNQTCEAKRPPGMPRSNPSRCWQSISPWSSARPTHRVSVNAEDSPKRTPSIDLID